MSKEYLEALNYVWYNYYTEELSQNEVEEIEKNLNIVQDGLKRLESIDNANPSEALVCLENLFSNVVSTTYNRESSLKDFNVIKQALLKAQEPKQYLKWEDLEFTRDEKVMLVKMGDTVYKVLYRRCDNTKEVQLLSEDEKCYYIGFTGNYKDNVQLFNDLHLERVEE